MTRKSLTALVGSLLISTTITGCATMDFADAGQGRLLPASLDVPQDWENAAVNETTPLTQTPWLTRFDDPALDALVVRAYRHNPDLDQLRAALDRANALSARARSGLLPVLDGLLGGSRRDVLQGADASTATLNVEVQASWEPDIWGRIRATVEATGVDRDAAEFDLEAARQVLAASVVESAFLAIEANRLADVSQRNLDALTETLGFVEVQYERGLRSEQELVLIRADVMSATAALQQAKGAERQALRALNVLTGSYPETDLTLASDLPPVPVFSALGQPVDILRQRPDLRAAQLRVEAAHARHRSATAAQKPRLTLGGTFGGADAQLGQIFDPAQLASTLFANLSAPLFDGGQRQADVAVAQADIDAALARYRRVALDAFQEVEDQRDQGTVLSAQERALQSALSDARKALKFTRFRYESAEVDLLNVLQVQQRVSFIEAQLVSLRRARLAQYLNLSLALGVPPTD